MRVASCSAAGARAAAVAALVAPGCGLLDGSDDAVDPAGVESVAVDVEPIRPDMDLNHLPVAVDDVLVSSVVPNVDSSSGEGVGLVMSTDRGASWEPVALPSRPPELDFVEELVLHDLDGAIAVSMEQPFPSPEGESRYLSVSFWVSQDGQAWHGGRVEVPEPGDRPTEVRDVWRLQDGRLIARLHTRGSGAESQHIESGDEGETWRPAQCREDVVPSECEAPPAVDLLVDDDQAVSFDEGRSWRDTEFPFVDEGKLVDFQAVERADGGWLGRAESAEADGSDTWNQGYLVRSDDGLWWERVFGRDSRCESGFPGEWISMPVPFGSRWLVAYACDNPKDDGPLLSQLYLVDSDGEDFVAIADSYQADVFYEQPIVVGVAVLVPTVTFRESDVSLLWLDLDGG